MAKEVAVKEAAGVPAINNNEFFDGITVGAQDLLIPKLLIMQLTSVLVAAGRAVMGEWRNSVTGELVGHASKPLKVVPFYVKKSWDILHEIQGKPGKYEFAKSIPVDDNPQSPGYNGGWDAFEVFKDVDKNGATVNAKRHYRFDFFVLLPEEVAKGPTALPYVLSFKVTSLKAGKKMFGEAYERNRSAGLPPFHFQFDLTGEKKTNDQGTFFVVDTWKSEPADAATVAKAIEWFRRIKTSTFKVDESDGGAEPVEAEAQTAKDVSDKF